MLRNALLIVALLLTAGGALALLTGHGEAAPVAIWGGVIAVAVLFERWRYQPPAAARAGGNWQATGEQFIDPESGAAMEVQYDALTGERRYVVKFP